MKKQWHIQTRVLITLISLTAVILITVGLVFNIAVRGYIKNRVSAQLSSVSKSVSSERKGGKGQHSDSKFDDRPDRITGTTGSAVVLNDDGELLSNLHGKDTIGKALASYFSTHTLDESVQNRTITLDDGKYVVSVAQDPAQNGCWLVSYIDVTAILAFTTRINLVLLVIICAAILLSVLLSRRFARSFAEPVQELSSFAQEIGSGKFETRDLQFRDVEFGQLALSMNQMASALQEANQKQETFFQNVSHELRTPLTAIRGNAEGIIYGVMDPETAGRVILKESDKLGGMVEDILYISRMDRTAPENTIEPLDLRDVLSLCVSEQRSEAENRGISFQFGFDEAPVLLSMREQDAQRLFGNLISNAIRYAKATIRLTCHAADDYVTVIVSDDGSGIRPEDLPYIFERFYKGPDGRHGIGLSIVRSIVDAYHGEIEIRNEDGTVFEMKFKRS